MTKQAVMVTYNVKPGAMDLFLPVLRDHVAKTRAQEPGCLQFDVLIPNDRPDCLHVYEIYADEEAFGLHNASEQLASYRRQSDPLLNERAITWCTLIE